MAQNDGTLTIEDAKIIWRNFAGREGLYNAEGDRNFNVVLEPRTAEAMLEDGWPVKYTKDREVDGETLEGEPVIQVSVKFRGRGGKPVKPPRIVMLTSHSRVELGEDEVELLDHADVRHVDLIIRPYEWAVSGKTGIKAYLKTMFVTIEEDYLERKYAEVQPGGEDDER